MAAGRDGRVRIDWQIWMMLSSDLKEDFSNFPKLAPSPPLDIDLKIIQVRLSVEYQFVRPLLCYHVELRTTKTRQVLRQDRNNNIQCHCE